MYRALRRALLRFYDAHARDLPWRRTRDPYAIWVSEIMLQQTRVDTVRSYYDPFLERFPTPEALAAADEDTVMAAWSGLGYYRRARLLHAGVREVVARYGGEVPRDADARRGLPGVGRYTAGAIGSIAFDLPEPLVDGNVARVLGRIFAVGTPLGRADTERALWAHAEALVPGERPGALNQALMELGATLCNKAAPRCEQCPARKHCRARAEGRTAELPVPRPRKAPRELSLVALRAEATGGRGLFLQRAERGLFAGLWNLPMAEGEDRGSAHALMTACGLRGRLSSRPGEVVEHVLTHRRLRVTPFGVTGATLAGEKGATPAHSVTPFAPEALDTLGISALTRRLLG